MLWMKMKMRSMMSLWDLLKNNYAEPVDPAPPTEADLDEVVFWYEENFKEINE